MHGNGGHPAVTRILVPLADALREHWRTAAWLGLASAAAIATLAPVLSLAGTPVLQPSPIRATDLGLAWTSGVQSPAALQSGAIARLLALLLVIAGSACAVAIIMALTLQWTRSGARGVDTSVRRASGASRRDLALSFLGEGVVIALAAVPLGLAAGYCGLRMALRAWPDALGKWSYAPGPVAMATATALLLGALLPLRHARGERLVNLPANPLSLFPPVVQIGASLAILLAATLVSRQATLLIGDGNTAADGTVYQLAGSDADPATRSAQYLDMLRDLAAIEDMEGVSLTSPGALVGLGTVDWVETDCGQCLVGGVFLNWHSERASHAAVSPDSFRVMGIPLVAGRAFTLSDSWKAPRVAIVNRQMAALHFESGNPLGRTIYMGTERVPYTVVGVVDDAKAPGRSGGLQPRFAVYLSSLQHPVAAADLVIRGNAAAARAQATLTAFATIHHSTGIPESRVRRAATLPMLWFATWFRVEAIAALLLGALGAMVSVSIWASALVPELAIHRALGATRRHLAAAVLGRSVLIIAAGILVALTAVGPALRAVLSEILGDLPLLPVTDLLVPAALLSAAAVIGALRPLRRAIRTEPAALLSE
jgi:putative ABC transport system permease protein